MIDGNILTISVGLLSVAVNSVYVVLTYKMLRAMHRDSLREHRLRHLDDIKTQLVRPLLEWTGLHVLPVIQQGVGPLPVIVVHETPIHRRDATPGDLSVEYRRQLGPTFQSRPAVSSSTFFKHAKEHHFPAQLGAYDEFIERLFRFFDDVTTFGRKCAGEIASATQLRRGSEKGEGAFADSDAFVMACVRDFMGERRPQIGTHEEADGVLRVRDAYNGSALARGPHATVKDWFERAHEIMADRWSSSDLTERTHQLIAEGKRACEELRTLEHTYDLIGDCEYVGVRSNDS
jgi:hypothetical protein